MSRFACLILLVFLYIGVDAMFTNVITGTTDGEVVARTFFPLVIAVVLVAFLWRLFR